MLSCTFGARLRMPDVAEFYVVGCAIAAGGEWRTRRPAALGLAGAALLAGVWLVCMSQMRAA